MSIFPCIFSVIFFLLRLFGWHFRRALGYKFSIRFVSPCKHVSHLTFILDSNRPPPLVDVIDVQKYQIMFSSSNTSAMGRHVFVKLVRKLALSRERVCNMKRFFDCLISRICFALIITRPVPRSH